MQSNFYVYMVRDLKNVPRYVGKGRGRRSEDHRRRSHNKVLRGMFRNADGRLPIMKVCGDLPNEQAVELERFLIAELGRIDIGTGPLVNFTDGGEGSVGLIRTPESRAKMSAAKKGKRIPHLIPLYTQRKGIPKSAQHAEKLRQHLARTLELRAAKISASLRRPKTAAEIAANPALQKGVPKTESHRIALSAAHKGKKRSSNAIRASADAHRGLARSPETKARMSASQKMAWKRRRQRAAEST